MRGGLHSAQKTAKELSRDIMPYSLDQARPICWGGFFLAFVYLTKRSKKRLRKTCQVLILDVYEKDLPCLAARGAYVQSMYIEQTVGRSQAESMLYPYRSC